MTYLWLSGVFFQALNTSKIQNSFSAGTPPGSRWGSLQHSPRPPSWLGGGTPSLYTPPRRRTSVSAPRLSALPTQIPGYAYESDPRQVSNLYTWPSSQKGWTVFVR